MKRVLVTIPAEWEKDFDALKKEMFYNDSKAAMLRFVIQKGIISIQEGGKK